MMSFVETLGAATLLLFAAMFGVLGAMLCLLLLLAALPFFMCIFLAEEHPETVGVLTLLALCLLLVF